VGSGQGIGFTEKRAQDDGLDASDVYMGARYLSLSGSLYGDTPGDLFDRLQHLRTALTPTTAYDMDKDDYGYIPLTFSMPTLDPAFSGGVKELEFRARPIGQPQFTVRRDTGAFAGGGMQGGTGPGASNLGEKGGGIAWRTTFECKDPRMYVRPQVWVNFTGNTPATNISNRGDYPAPLDVLLGVTSSGADSSIEIDIGGGTIIIKLPSLVNAVVRYSGELKVLTVQSSGSSTDVLRMDLLSFGSEKTHPKVPPNDLWPPIVANTYAVRMKGAAAVLSAGTRMMYSESFA
jgi:hypothetical protein